MFNQPRVRVALGLGDQQLEWRLRPALEVDDELEIAAACLSADQLVAVVEARQVDALLVAWGLHRLTEGLIEQLERSGLPMLLLVPDPADERWTMRRAPVLALDGEPVAVHDALLAARRGERIQPRRPQPSPDPLPVLKAQDRPRPAAQLVVIGVAGGAGSPGRTTIAVSLAAALGAAEPTVLVELDLSAPAMAAYLDRDPGRNICTLGHVVRESPHAWSHALADELQVLTRHLPGAAVLCGLPKREMRASVAPQLIERLVAELSARYRFVVLDVGAELLGTDSAAVAHRAALSVTQHVLVVSGSDLISLWHTRVVLKQLEHHLSIAPEHMSLVLNRHDLRHHHARSEIEWHLGAHIAAVIPHDFAAAQRAITEQRPLALDPTSRAGRAIVQLAERLHQGELRLPYVEAAAGGRRWWRPSWPRRANPSAQTRRPSAEAPVELTAAAAAQRRRGRAW